MVGCFSSSQAKAVYSIVRRPWFHHESKCWLYTDSIGHTDTDLGILGSCCNIRVLSVLRIQVHMLYGPHLIPWNSDGPSPCSPLSRGAPIDVCLDQDLTLTLRPKWTGPTRKQVSRNYFTFCGRDVKGSCITSKELLDFGRLLSRTTWMNMDDHVRHVGTTSHHPHTTRSLLKLRQRIEISLWHTVAYQNTVASGIRCLKEERQYIIGFQSTLELILEINPHLVWQIWNSFRSILTDPSFSIWTETSGNIWRIDPSSSWSPGSRGNQA